MVERLTFGAAPRRLEGVLDVPAAARRGAVLCHPHPQYGGSMDNGVVVAIATALAASGVAVLRFNFGGVGRSEGSYGGGPAEVGDLGQAAAALAERIPEPAPLTLVGYSFGAWVALMAAADLPRVERVIAVAPPLDLLPVDGLDAVARPLSVVVGDRDQYCRLDRVAALGRESSRFGIEVLRGADHFLAGFEDTVARAVVAAVSVDAR